jgi:UDP-N-acetylglucosamine 2-epimerase (non-hydrolysing)
VVEAHRRENIGARHRAIFRAIRRLADLREVQVAFSVHPNPAVQEPVREILAGHPRIHLLQPLDYPEFMQLVAKSRLVLTDSGGLQKEAAFLGVVKSCAPRFL